jgi:hypothetical protein
MGAVKHRVACASPPMVDDSRNWLTLRINFVP